jgi:hypothetical protein
VATEDVEEHLLHPLRSVGLHTDLITQPLAVGLADRAATDPQFSACIKMVETCRDATYNGNCLLSIGLWVNVAIPQHAHEARTAQERGTQKGTQRVPGGFPRPQSWIVHWVAPRSLVISYRDVGGGLRAPAAGGAERRPIVPANAWPAFAGLREPAGPSRCIT